MVLPRLALAAISLPLAPTAGEGYQPLPAIARSGKAEFEAEAARWGNTTDGMSSTRQANPLFFSELTDFWCAWQLTDRKRRPALLVDDLQVEYAPYVRGIVPQVKRLVEAFRAAGLPIFWSTWWRWGPQDGYFNAMDRFYGPVGWETPANALYNHDREHGGDVLAEVGPVTDEERRRVMHKSYSLDMFDERPMEWLVPAGQGTLHQELQELGVDTIVQVGAWTDDCIISTAFHGFSLQYDVVLVEDGVSTASKQHFNAIEVMRGAVAKVLGAAQVAAYIDAGLPVKRSAAPGGKSRGGRVHGRATSVAEAASAQALSALASEPTASRLGGLGPEVANLLNTLLVGSLGVALGVSLGRGPLRARHAQDLRHESLLKA